MIIRLLAVFAFLSAPAAVFAKAADTVSTFTLDNGLEVVVIEDHRAPIVTHMVWYRVGSADEKRGKSGIAHFLEHLMFKGTDNLAPGEFSDIVASIGGTENAFTSYDYTGYFQRVSAENLPLVMGLEADRMQGLKLTEAEVLPERDVVIEERNSRVEVSPGSLFGESRRALMFNNHPYGIPVIGWMHEIEQLSREDALEFYKRYYAPNNAILVVAGDTTPEQMKVLAQEHYGDLVPSETIPPRIRAAEPPRRAPVRTVYSDPLVRQPYVIRSYAADHRKAGDQKEAAALTILAELLGGSGVTSVMGQELQLKQKIAINQAAFYDGMSYDPTTFAMYAVPAPGVSLQELEDAMDQVIADFITGGIDTEHLARLKVQIDASEIYALDDQSGRARRYGEALTNGLTIDDVHSWSETLQSVTAEDVIAAAERLFDINKSVTGWLISDRAGANQ